MMYNYGYVYAYMSVNVCSHIHLHIPMYSLGYIVTYICMYLNSDCVITSRTWGSTSLFDVLYSVFSACVIFNTSSSMEICFCV